MAPKPKDRKAAKGKKAATTKVSSTAERDPKTMTFQEREEVCEMRMMYWLEANLDGVRSACLWSAALHAGFARTTDCNRISTPEKTSE